MSYTPKSWNIGDPVTYADMNHIETQFDEAYDYYLAHGHADRYYDKTAARAAFWYAGSDGPGSGADADLLYKSTGNLHAASFAGLGIPAGIIIMWEDEEIPAGWHLCDGTAGTRDLRERMILGAGTGSAYSVGDTGGSATFTATGTITISGHALTTSEMPSHCHPYTDRRNNNIAWATGGNNITRCNVGAYTSGTTAPEGSDSAHGHSAAEGTSFTGDAVASLPYCKALKFIQKL